MDILLIKATNIIEVGEDPLLHVNRLYDSHRSRNNLE